MLGGLAADMHELSVTQSLLEIALRHGREAGAQRVTDLYLVIGEWSSIVDDSVQFYWDIVAQGTPAEGARLHFERIPARATCGECGREFAPGGESLLCPGCGSSRLRLLTGDEFRLDSIAIEPAAQPRQAMEPE
jgi:hydrogenase nickel incorporation protein HypA/HybF